MNDIAANKYRAAIEVLNRGRELLVGGLADDVLDQADDLIAGGYQFNEFLEIQGTRLHFLGLLVAQLEQSAEAIEEREAATAMPSPPKPKRKPRAKKLAQQPSAGGKADDGC